MTTPSTASSLLSLLSLRAQHTPDKCAFVYLRDGETSQNVLSYRELDGRAQAIATMLSSYCSAGDRVLLLFPSGTEYVEAFFGCLYANLVPVPGYPPTSAMHAERMLSIVADAGARVVLVAGDPGLVSHRLRAVDAHLELIFLDVRQARDGARLEALPNPSPDDVCYLQYTSGSTGIPKGVMVTHGNLLANCAMFARASGEDENSVLVCWVPLFHDLGLIMGCLYPLFLGGTSVLLAPASFIQKPVRWLRAISEYKATVTCGPNFSYALCVKQVTPEHLHGVDLSSLRLALNAAETVHADTIDDFCAKFSPYGFKRTSFFPGYGLAESTLLITGGPVEQLPQYLRVSLDKLQAKMLMVARPEEASLRMVGCGAAWQELRIIDPSTFEECAPGQIGEVWTRGPCVTRGYWNRPAETARVFDAHIHGVEGLPFLRTGDLGTFCGDQIYIAGRLKDLIVIRGTNYYPADIEHAVARSHPSLRIGHIAAFAIAGSATEDLVVIAEIERVQRKTVDIDATIRAIRSTIAGTFALEPKAVLLLHPATIPKTSSGKIRRNASRTAFLESRLSVLAQDIRGELSL